MRAVPRRALPQRLAAYLAKKQARADQGADVETLWRGARKTKTVGEVLAILRAMMGPRARCMYCEDSQGTDIEHFRPKRCYPGLAFEWSNLLLACAGCNRKKGDRFPEDASGEALLIDPSSDNPWDYLFFDGDTGNIVARWRPDLDGPDPKGATTASDEYLQINVEAVIEGRLRVMRNLLRAVKAFLQSPSGDAEVQLCEALRDNEDYGLTSWFLHRDGRDEAPFAELRRQHGQVWERLLGEIPQPTH